MLTTGEHVETAWNAFRARLARATMTSSEWPISSAVARQPWQGDVLDKKTKKRIDVLNSRLRKLRQQLAGARQQLDDPEEAKRLENAIAAAEADLANLKAE